MNYHYDFTTMLLHYDIYYLKTIDGRLHGYISLFLENEQQCNVMKHQNHEQWVLLKITYA